MKATRLVIVIYLAVAARAFPVEEPGRAPVVTTAKKKHQEYIITLKVQSYHHCVHLIDKKRINLYFVSTTI